MGDRDEINRRNWPRVIKYLEHIEGKTFDSLDACRVWCDFAKVHAGATMKQGQAGPWHWIDRMAITARCWLQ